MGISQGEAEGTWPVIASSTAECSGAVGRESDVRLAPRVTKLYTLVSCQSLSTCLTA